MVKNVVCKSDLGKKNDTLRLSWNGLGASWDRLGAILSRLGDFWGSLGTPKPKVPRLSLAILEAARLGGSPQGLLVNKSTSEPVTSLLVNI